LQFCCYVGITKKGAQDFAERMKNGNFPMVEKLTICFRHTRSLQYSGLYAIAETIPVAFPNLKELVFDYLGYNAFNDDEIRKKAAVMLKGKLKNLPEKFDLSW